MIQFAHASFLVNRRIEFQIDIFFTECNYNRYKIQLSFSEEPLWDTGDKDKLSRRVFVTKNNYRAHHGYSTPYL